MMAPHIDPIALQIGGFAIHWYGLMYVAAFSTAWFLGRKHLIETGTWKNKITAEQYEGLFSSLIFAAIAGGRLGYVLFYNPSYYSSHPIEIFYLWQGGMSFHGGLIGPMIMGWWYCRKHQLPFLKLADTFAIVAPLGLAFGRMGNFINGELWGRVSDVPWAMVFPSAGVEPRHPSQLYEMGLEGLLLFILLWFTRQKKWPDGTRISLFLFGYAIARIVCENFRQPDEHIGFLFGSLTMGMLLSSGMIILSLAIKLFSSHKKIS
ncbi:MAG: prolipoprotein diacylglyceryl transferase [Mariprofundaceae bacterium]